MKTLYLIIFLISLNFAGCYTILWSPDQDFPTEGSYYDDGYIGDGYYSDPYYGGYSYYYEYPWWLSIAPPTTVNESGNANRPDDVRSSRNSTGTRNSSDENLRPPTRSSGSTSGSTGSETTNSAPQSEVRTKSDSSDNSGSSNSRNSGSRNSGNRRK